MMKDEIDLIINEVNEKKGEDVLFVDIEKGIHPVTDNIVVVSALNKIHLNALINLISILPRDELLGFVQIGSSDEYGDSIAPQFEEQKEIPFSPYSYSKFAATHFIKYLNRAESFPGKILRPFL